MGRLLRCFFVCFTFIPMVCLGEEMSPTINLQILETTDLHTHMADYDYYADKPVQTFGFVRTATLIKKLRGQAKNTLLIDNGDLLQGNPLGDYMATEKGLQKGEIHPVYKAMNLLHYDVGNLGNHDFNYGLDFQKKAIQGANFPYVNANVVYDGPKGKDKPVYTPYIILTKTFVDGENKKQTVKIGVLGLVPPQIMQWDQANLVGKVKVRDMTDTARYYIPQMKKQGADIIIVVAHTGFSSKPKQGMDENSASYLSKIPGVDVLLLGHSHRVFPGKSYAGFPGANLKNGTLNGVPTVMAGFWGNHVGAVHLVLKKEKNGQWQEVKGTATTYPIYEKKDGKTVALVKADPEVVKAIEAEHKGTIASMRRPAGETKTSLYTYFSLVQDDSCVQAVSLAQKAYVEKKMQGTPYAKLPVLSAASPFKAGGRGGPQYYTDIAKGPLALKNIADLYLYPNTLQVVRLTGAGVREWLEKSVRIFNTIKKEDTQPQALINDHVPSYNFDIIDGVTYDINLTQKPRYDADGKLINPQSHRIANLRYQGKPIDPKAFFLVATNNYRAQGGGHFPFGKEARVVFKSPDETRSILIKYVKKHSPLDIKADNNWKFMPLGGKVTLTFKTGPGALKYLPKYPQFKKIKMTKSGFVLLEFHR